MHDSTPAVRAAYRAARTHAKLAYREGVRDYVARVCENAGTNPAQQAYWRIVDDLLGRKARKRTEPSCSPDVLNDALLGKVAALQAPLQSKPLQDVAKSTRASFEFKPVTEADVLHALQKAKPTRSAGVDDVPMRVLKQVGPSISLQIAALTNALLREGHWPSEWKQAEIHPLWKKIGAKTIPSHTAP